MACKRSAVRARLAPLVRSEIRTDRTGSTAGKYSNGGGVGRRMCVRSGMFPRLGLLAGHRIPGADRRCPACHLGKSRPIGPVTLATWPPPTPLGGPFLPATVAAFASGPGHAGRPGRCDSLPGTAPADQDGAFADGRRGARAQRVAPMVSARRWARWCAAPLRRRVAPWRSSLRPCRRAGASREEPGAARRTGNWPSTGRQVACPPRALTLPMPGPGPPPMAEWAAHRAQLAPCRPPRRQPGQYGR